MKAKIDSARGETRIKPAKNTHTMTISEKEREFNKTGGVPRTANGAKFLISDEIFNHDNMTECGSVAQIAAEILADCTKSNSTNHRAIKQNQVDENPEINNSNNYDSHLLTRVDVAGDDDAKASFSPGVSPIGNVTKLQDASIGGSTNQPACWRILENTNTTENLKEAMMRGTRNHSNFEQQQLKPFTNQQLPLPI